MRLFARLGRRRVRPENPADRHRLVVAPELVEVAALTTRAGAHDVSWNLRRGPDVVRKTDRTTPRRAIAHPARRHPNRDHRAEAETRERRRPRRTRVERDLERLDSESVLVREECDLEVARTAGELRLADCQ